ADLDLLALLGRADEREAVRILRVEVREVVRVEGAEHALPHRVLDLVRGHPAVQRVRHRELEVLDARSCGELDDLLEDELAHVGGPHRRQGQRDVIDRDRELHPRPEELGKRFGVQGVRDRVPDRPAHVPDPRQRVRWVDHPRAERELLQPEPLALVDQERRGPLVHLQHEPRPRHVRNPLYSACGSNATFNVPSLPAASAWSIASRQRRSGYVAPTIPSSGHEPASWVATSNACRRSFPIVSTPPVYAPTSSSSRNQSGVRSAPCTGMPAITIRPPALVVRARGRASSASRRSRSPRRPRRAGSSGGETTSVAPNPSAHSRCTPCLATTVIRPGRASSFSASRTRSPTVPAPISRTSAFGSILARRAAWIAHESGSISTARRSESSPGTGWSCERCATN